MDRESLIKWARAEITDVFEEWHSRPEGLSHYEAENRLSKWGENSLAKKKTHPGLHIFISNLKNPLVVVLLIISAVSFSIGQAVEATIVGLMVVFSVTLNFFQEHKASRAAEELKEKVATKTVVIRGGKQMEIKTTKIVAGDIVELNAGDLVPADARIIKAKDFFVNQAVLTGESIPTEKNGDRLAAENPDLNDMTNIIFQGTNVVTGTATAIIVRTGEQTELGKISKGLTQMTEEDDFSKGIDRFTYLVIKIIIVFIIFIFVTNSLLKHDIFQSFIFSIAVAVGITPEFLPMIMSVTMAKGSVNMAKKGVIVKKLTAIPTFGSMDVLCTDKTGTLTEGKIQLLKYIDIHGDESDKVLKFAYLNSSMQTGITSPMDAAVMEYRKFNLSEYKKIDEIPFDFDRKKMSVVVESDERYMITKGAPEEIFRSCGYYDLKGKKTRLNKLIIEKFEKLYTDLSKDGFRVLAVAIKTVSKGKDIYDKADETGMEIIGLTAFLDPAKKTVKDVLLELEKMEIEIKIVTGDNELVTEKIANDVGLKVKGVILGHQIHSMSPEQLQLAVKNNTIFARFSPDEKNMVINAIRSNGHVVGYMGDGINDAQSLKSADVGVSVDNAVDVAKDSADVILTHKSLHELKDGVIEGRKTFGNTMKYIMMGISSNFGNMFSVLGAVLFLPFLPMLPVQILLNNFLYDFSQLTIPTDNVDEEFIKKPKRWDINFIKNFMLIFGPISSLFDFVTFAVLFVLFKSQPAVFQTGWFMESLATQVLVIHVIRTKRIPFIQSRASRYLTVTTILAVIIGWILPRTVVGTFFGFTKLPVHMTLVLILIVAGYLLLVEMGKRLFYRKFSL